VRNLGRCVVADDSRVLLARQPSDDHSEVRSTHRLVQHRVEVELVQGRSAFGGQGTHDDHPEIPGYVRVLLEPPQDILATHARHGQVEQHQVELLGLQTVHSFQAVASLERDASLALRHEAEHVADVVVIIDDKDSERGRGQGHA